MKTLAQVVEQVSKELDLSKNKLSLKIGKSRNYLSETIRVGVSAEKEQEVINLLLELIDDEVKFLRNEVERVTILNKEIYSENISLNEKIKNVNSINKTHCDQIESMVEKLDNLQAIITEKNEHIKIQDGIINRVRDKNKNLEHQITILKKDLDYKEGVIQNREAKKSLAHYSGKESHMDKVVRHNSMLICRIDEITAELEREKARSASFINYTESEIKSEQKKIIDDLSGQIECFENKNRQLRQFVIDDRITIDKLHSKIKKMKGIYYWSMAFIFTVIIMLSIFYK